MYKFVNDFQWEKYDTLLLVYFRVGLSIFRSKLNAIISITSSLFLEKLINVKCIFIFFLFDLYMNYQTSKK